MPRVKKPDWQPGEACQLAYDRIQHTADYAARTLWGEDAGEGGPSQLAAMAMMYFLLRIAPADIQDLYFSPGGLASLNHKPFPPELPTGPGLFTAMDVPEMEFGVTPTLQ